jgi:hypothetical protein
MRTFLREDAAWVAGLFEGEGTIVRGKHYAPAVTISMTDEDVVRRIGDVLGFGTVFGPYDNGPRGDKPVWKWSASTFEQTQAFIALIWPWLGGRRRQRATELLTECRQTWSYSRWATRVEETIAFQMFGKPHRDLSPEERRRYNRACSLRSRKKVRP